MNPRHAAALALVGWYLMVPPPTPDRQGPDTAAPLSKWRHWLIFDSAEECQERLDMIKSAPSAEEHGPIEEVLRAFNKSTQCIATDDPRLKEK